MILLLLFQVQNLALGQLVACELTLLRSSLQIRYANNIENKI